MATITFLSAQFTGNTRVLAQTDSRVKQESKRLSVKALDKGLYSNSFDTSAVKLDWLKSPVTKYFFLIILFDNPIK